MKNLRNRKIQTPKAPNRYEIEFDSKAQRAQGGKGFLSQSISVQESQKSMAKLSIPREEKGVGRKRTEEGETGATGWSQGKRKAHRT